MVGSHAERVSEIDAIDEGGFTMRVGRVLGDYRFTISGRGLQIEVLDYHAEPLILTTEELRRLGLDWISPQDDYRRSEIDRA